MVVVDGLTFVEPLADAELNVPGVMAMPVAPDAAQLRVLLVPELTLIGSALNEEIVGAEHQIESSSLHRLKAAVVRGNEFERNLARGRRKLPAKHGTKHREGMVPPCDAEGCLFAGGVKYVSAEKAVKLGKGDFQFATDGLAFGGQVITTRPADE